MFLWVPLTVLSRHVRPTPAPCVPYSFSSPSPIMPRDDGAFTLSDVRSPVLSVVCEPCGRRERYAVERLMRPYGWVSENKLDTYVEIEAAARGSLALR